jgi:hypothetical protein
MPRRALEGSTKKARIFAACVHGSSAEQRGAETPTSAGDQLAVFLGDKIGLVLLAAEFPGGTGDQRIEPGDVGQSGVAQLDGHDQRRTAERSMAKAA